MLELVAIFAVHGHEELRLNESEHKFQLVFIGVSRNVNIVHAVVDDVCALSEQVVDDVIHRFLVAGDRR